MNWTKRLFFLSIGTVVPLVLGIFFLELIFGSWFREDQWSKVRAINIIRDVKFNYDFEFSGKTQPVLTYTRDKNGLRGFCKDNKDINVLTIGGSTTDQRYISDGETYQDYLQVQLSEKFGKQVCISNAGVDGHTTFGHLESFKIWFPLIEGLKPNYFLFYIGINDAAFRRNEPIYGTDRSKRDYKSIILNTLRHKSAIYDLLRNLRNIWYTIRGKILYAGHSNSPPSKIVYSATIKTNSVEVQIAKNTEDFEKRFLELMAHVRSYGAKPICVSQPHLFAKVVDGINKGVDNLYEYAGVVYNGLDYDMSISALNMTMMRLCLENDGYFIDIASKKFEDGDFYDFIHMTHSGVKRLANYMYDEFVRQKIRF